MDKIVESVYVLFQCHIINPQKLVKNVFDSLFFTAKAIYIINDNYNCFEFWSINRPNLHR